MAGFPAVQHKTKPGPSNIRFCKPDGVFQAVFSRVPTSGFQQKPIEAYHETFSQLPSNEGGKRQGNPCPRLGVTRRQASLRALDDTMHGRFAPVGFRWFTLVSIWCHPCQLVRSGFRPQYIGLSVNCWIISLLELWEVSSVSARQSLNPCFQVVFMQRIGLLHLDIWGVVSGAGNLTILGPSWRGPRGLLKLMGVSRHLISRGERHCRQRCGGGPQLGPEFAFRSRRPKAISAGAIGRD